MKLHALRRTARERQAREEPAEMQEPEGIEIHVSHEHMQKMGIDSPPRAGTAIELQGLGHVVSSHSENVGGKMRHHMRVRLTHAGVLHDDHEAPRAGIRGDLERATADSGKVRMAAAR